MAIRRVITGGQVGIDQVVMRWAQRANLETGGTAPREFRTADGPNESLAWKFNMQELECDKTTPLPMQYRMRTVRNIDQAHGAFVFRISRSQFTDRAIGYCQSCVWRAPKLGLGDTPPDIKHAHRPIFSVYPDILKGKHSKNLHSPLWEMEVQRAQTFIKTHRIQTLYVFGHSPRIMDTLFHRRITDFLRDVINQ